MIFPEASPAIDFGDAWGEARACDNMAWAIPEYSRQEVNAAGRMLRHSYDANWSDWTTEEWDKYWAAIEVINNWRSAHGYPLNTFQITLRRSARRFDGDALIAQRTKRLVSIGNKLYGHASMKLTQMQDVGGCRAVLKSVSEVRELQSYYEKQISFLHECSSVDDYISSPKPTGYRGIHFIYRYKSDKISSLLYNDLKIELQLRSRYQHAWATAVETVGTFVGQALKSSQGEGDWLRFFELMGTAIAIRERQPAVPNTPTVRKELTSELKELARRLDVENRLRGYNDALRRLGEQTTPDSKYYLLQLDPRAEQLTISGFAQDELPIAQDRYAEAERWVREHAGTDAVLVSVESLAALERAYPNYFADTRIFMQLMNQALSGNPRGIFIPQLSFLRTLTDRKKKAEPS